MNGEAQVARPVRRGTDVGVLRALRTLGGLGLVGIFVLGLWMTRAGARWPSIYVMTGDSMAPTLHAGEYFLAWGPPEELRRGELVIFRYEDDDGVFHVLRRLVALPGDTIAMDSGVVRVNGRARDWPFRILRPEASRSELAIVGNLYDWGPWVVPPDSVVLLSDTRDILGWPDSRFVGFIPRHEVLARATRRLGSSGLDPGGP